MTHTHLVRAVELALGALPGVLVLANNQGTAHYANKNTGRTYVVSYGLGDGTPDLLVFLAPEGRVLGLECKTGSGTPSPAQKKCRAVWATFGVTVAVVRSVEEAREALERALARRVS